MPRLTKFYLSENVLLALNIFKVQILLNYIRYMLEMKCYCVQELLLHRKSYSAQVSDKVLF